jgi:sigma-B regulation protein RsbU (phosphoserine phosphatase)
VEEARQGDAARRQLDALQQELEIAARIQASILPREFCPGREDFGIYAEMRPARVVGGDFYDFFLIDERRLGFVIGDVSGKGIPAALFMAVSRTLLDAVAGQGLGPAECLDYANQILGKQGEPGVYVTVFYGVLHTDTGELEYCLGGHNPPYRISPAGELRPIQEPGGVVVGLLPESIYETGTCRLEPGESVFLFTDGVTEALDPEEHFFTERRLKQVLSGCGGLAPRDTVARVLSAVAEFTTGAAQSDDITTMCVKWNGEGRRV